MTFFPKPGRLFLPFLLLHLQAGATPLFDTQSPPSQAQLTVESLLSEFRLDAAERALPQLNSPALEQFYLFHIVTYRYLTDQDTRYLTQAESLAEPLIQHLKRLPDSDSKKLIFLAEVYGKIALMGFMQKQYLNAAWDIRNSRKYLKESQQAFPSQAAQLKLSGIYEVAFGAVPKKFQWITHLLGYNGDIQTGLRELSLAQKNTPLLQMEAMLAHYYTQKNMAEKPREAIAFLQQKRKAYTLNILIDYCLAAGYLSLKQNEQALILLGSRERYKNDPGIHFIPLWDFQLGKAQYYKGRYQQAESHFQSYLRTHKGNVFRTDAIFRMGMACLLVGRKEAAKQYFLRLVEDDNSDLEEDIYAAYMARSFLEEAPGDRVLTLFRARNAYDGGYFSQAIGLLEALEAQASLPVDLTAQIDYTYGRIYHSQGLLEAAKAAYNRCISQPDGQEHRWNQAYAMFYLAEIARDQKQLDQARQYYERALSYDDYFYQSGLENRCKIALKMMDKT